MASSPTDKNNEAPGDPSEVKRKLAWRMGFAGLMIVALLGSLALFDRLSSTKDEESAAPQFSEPVPVAKKLITQPVTPVEPAPEVAKEENKAVAQTAPTSEPTAAPVDRAAPRVERQPRSELAAQPSAPRAAAAPAAGAARVVAATPKAPAGATPRSETPVAAAPAPTPAPIPTPPRLFSGYALQAGVFADPRRAEELHARLVLEGIPATIEARVQVGPFNSRAEAEAARAKMKAMGIDSVLLPPKGVKH